MFFWRQSNCSVGPPEKLVEINTWLWRCMQKIFVTTRAVKFPLDRGSEFWLAVAVVSRPSNWSEHAQYQKIPCYRFLRIVPTNQIQFSLHFLYSATYTRSNRVKQTNPQPTFPHHNRGQLSLAGGWPDPPTQIHCSIHQIVQDGVISVIFSWRYWFEVCRDAC